MERRSRPAGRSEPARGAAGCWPARVWNIDPMGIPHYTAPTQLMRIMRYVEDGSIRFLPVSGTNPAVALPELHRSAPGLPRVLRTRHGDRSARRAAGVHGAQPDGKAEAAGETGAAGVSLDWEILAQTAQAMVTA